jgi:hypothetical protein
VIARLKARKSSWLDELDRLKAQQADSHLFSPEERANLEGEIEQAQKYIRELNVELEFERVKQDIREHKAAS